MASEIINVKLTVYFFRAKLLLKIFTIFQGAIGWGARGSLGWRGVKKDLRTCRPKVCATVVARSSSLSGKGYFAAAAGWKPEWCCRTRIKWKIHLISLFLHVRGG